MQYNFTKQEVDMLLKALSEYVDAFGGDADIETCEYTEYMLENGLGSALKKLYKNRNGFDVYKDFKSHRESYKYPTFEEWVSNN